MNKKLAHWLGFIAITIPGALLATVAAPPPAIDAVPVPAVGIAGLVGLAGTAAVMGIRYLKSRYRD